MYSFSPVSRQQFGDIAPTQDAESGTWYEATGLWHSECSEFMKSENGVPPVNITRPSNQYTRLPTVDKR